MSKHILPQSGVLNASGGGTIRFELDNATVTWDISQVSVTVSPARAGCVATIFLNGYYHCSTIAGSGDTAQGPPDIEFNPGDVITVVFVGGSANGIATVFLYYDERPRFII